MLSLNIINNSVAVIGGLFIAAYFVFIIWAACDALRNKKLWWFILIVGTPFVGATIYFFVEKEHDYMNLSEEEQKQ